MTKAFKNEWLWLRKSTSNLMYYIPSGPLKQFRLTANYIRLALAVKSAQLIQLGSQKTYIGKWKLIYRYSIDICLQQLIILAFPLKPYFQNNILHIYICNKQCFFLNSNLCYERNCAIFVGLSVSCLSLKHITVFDDQNLNVLIDRPSKRDPVS